MQKYITKHNIANALLFSQFAITSILEIYDLTPEMVQHLSLAGLLIGFWINTNKKEV